MGIVDRTIKRHFQPSISISQSQLFAERCCACGIFQRWRIIVRSKISNIVIILSACECAYVPISRWVNSKVVNHVSANVPIAVNVLRSCCSSTRSIVVNYHVAYTIACVAVIDICHERLLMLLNISIVKESKAVCERRLQSRITLSYVQRVTIIGNINKVTHAWLWCSTSIVYSKIAYLWESVSEIKSWRKVYNISNRIYAYTLITLREVCSLWLNHNTHVDVIFLSHNSQH